MGQSNRREEPGERSNFVDFNSFSFLFPTELGRSFRVPALRSAGVSLAALLTPFALKQRRAGFFSA
jgi:hypothetical protein